MGRSPAWISLSRIRRIQESMKNEKINGLLCILGIDSRFNEGCQELAEYLIFEFVDDSTQKRLPEDFFDELLFCIQVDQVHLYCPADVWELLLPIVSRWTNLIVHSKKVNDSEEEEDLKVQSLVTMAEGLEKVSVPCFCTGSHGTFDLLQVERWPLLQAYALEGYGKGQFFALSHEVSDASAWLQGLYRQLDSVRVTKWLLKDQSRFRHQWDTLISRLDKECASSSWRHVSEKELLDPLLSFYQYGRVQANSDASNRPPTVLFGVRSKHFGKQNGGDAVLSPEGAKPATHVVCQVTATGSPMSCARSFFFISTAADESESAQRRRLMFVYAGMVCAVNSLTRRMESAAALGTCLEACREELRQVIASTSFASGTPVVVLERYCDGQWSPAEHCTTGSYRVLVRIPAISGDGGALGDLVFEETLLVSVSLSQPEVRCLALTDVVPRTMTWVVDGQPGHRERAWLMKNETLTVCSSAGLSGEEPVEVCLSDEWLSFVSAHVGSAEVAMSEVRVQLCEKDKDGALVVWLGKHAHKLSPFVLTGDRLVVRLGPRGLKHLYSSVHRRWRDRWEHFSSSDDAQEWSRLGLDRADPLDSFLDHLDTHVAADKRAELARLLPAPAAAAGFDGFVLTVVWGPPGSFQDQVAHSITSQSKGDIFWSVYQEPLDSPSTLDWDNFAAFVHRLAHKKPNGVLLLLSGLVRLPALLLRLERSFPSLRIGCVCACLTPSSFVVQHCWSLSVLTNCLVPGFIQSIVMAASPQDPLRESAIATARALCPSAEVISAENGSIEHAADLEELLRVDAYTSVDAIRDRTHFVINCPDAAMPYERQHSVVVLRDFAPLDKLRFLMLVKELKKTGSQPADDGSQLYCIEGILRFTGNSPGCHASISIPGTSFRMSTAPAAFLTSYPSNFLRFTGTELNEDALTYWLEQCLPQKAVKKALLTRADLSKWELEAIQKSQHLSPLPSGWFYNGTNYVNLWGEKSATHPDMDKFVADYLAEKNAKIEQHNRSIQGHG